MSVVERTTYRQALTPRHREILTMVARGLTVQQVATELYLSHYTVKAHLQEIRFRLGASNTVHAVVLALRQGEIQLGEEAYL